MHRFAESFRRAFGQVTRLGVIGGASLALLASSQVGERGDGTCPAGETCAPGTPDGLMFEGAPLGTWPILSAEVIAAGGRQTFRLTYPTGGAFDLPFSAKVTSDDHQVVATGADRVTVAAGSAATGHLRIVDAGGELYDRLRIESAAISAVRAAPAYAAAYPNFDPPRWAAFAGGRTTVVLTLTDARSRPLADEQMAMRTAVPTERVAWDSWSLTAPPAGLLDLAVDAGDVVDRRARVAVVDRFDDVSISAPTQTGVGGALTVCFSAWLRGDRVGNEDDVLVVGVPRQYRIVGPATPLPNQPNAACLELRTDGPGTVRIEATMGGQTAVATTEVRGASSRAADGMAAWLGAPVEGERAALVEDAAAP